MLILSPTIKLFSLLLYNCNFATVMNYNTNLCFSMVLGNPVKGLFSSQGGLDPQGKNCCSKGSYAAVSSEVAVCHKNTCGKRHPMVGIALGFKEVGKSCKELGDGHPENTTMNVPGKTKF